MKICSRIDFKSRSSSLHFLFLILSCMSSMLSDKYSYISDIHIYLLSTIGVYLLTFIDTFASKIICSLANF